MTPRVADESGFSLVELLTAMVVGMIVLLALFGLVDTATLRQAKAVDRIEANGRGRVAMDLISQQLTSRVCISGAQGALVSASDNQIEFFASIGLTPESTTDSQRLVLQRRRLTYRPAPNNDVREEVWVGAAPTAATPAPTPPPTTAAPTRTSIVLEKAGLVPTTPPSATPIPFFRYYGMNVPPVTVPVTPPEPTQQLTPAPVLSATDLAKVERIDVSFAANGKAAGVNSPLQNQILDRSPGCYFG